ncbi:MAG: hypothetical protein WDZ77_02800 [Candidatus Pacearchaeota archaeon]
MFGEYDYRGYASGIDFNSSIGRDINPDLSYQIVYTDEDGERVKEIEQGEFIRSKIRGLGLISLNSWVEISGPVSAEN